MNLNMNVNAAAFVLVVAVSLIIIICLALVIQYFLIKAAVRNGIDSSQLSQFIRQVKLAELQEKYAQREEKTAAESIANSRSPERELEEE